MSTRLLAAVDQPQVLQQLCRAVNLGYDDPLAREIATRMQERLDYVQIEPSAVLDLGAGAGRCAATLITRYPKALLSLLDVSPALLPPPPKSALSQSSLGKWLTRYRHFSSTHPVSVRADAAHIPLSNNSQGLVWSNLLLPWVADISAVIEETHRVLQVGGLLMFSTLGPDTLRELDTLFDDAYPHRHQFPDMHDLGDLLGRSGFADPVVDMEYLTVEYAQMETLISDIRRAGAGLAHPQRKRCLSGRGLKSRLDEAWNRLSKDGRFVVRFEVIYGHAWRADTQSSVIPKDRMTPIHFHPRKPR